MKKTKPGESTFFVDESGDPIFYNHRGRCIVGEEGCSRTLIIGFIETQNPRAIREKILGLRDEVLADRYLKRVQSMGKTAVAFHAKDDCSEVRAMFFKLIESLDFKAQFVLATKDEERFRRVHRGKPNRFYDDLITQLFENVLHRFEENRIYFAVRGSSVRQKPMEKAIWRAKGRFQKKHQIHVDATAFKVEPQRPSGEPCLSVIDYMNWALQRAVTRGEMRFLEFVAEKVSLVRNLSAPGCPCFHRKNLAGLFSTAPLGLGSSSERTA